MRLVCIVSVALVADARRWSRRDAGCVTRFRRRICNDEVSSINEYA